MSKTSQIFLGKGKLWLSTILEFLVWFKRLFWFKFKKICPINDLQSFGISTFRDFDPFVIHLEFWFFAISIHSEFRPFRDFDLSGIFTSRNYDQFKILTFSRSIRDFNFSMTLAVHEFNLFGILTFLRLQSVRNFDFIEIYSEFRLFRDSFRI